MPLFGFPLYLLQVVLFVQGFAIQFELIVLVSLKLEHRVVYFLVSSHFVDWTKVLQRLNGYLSLKHVGVVLHILCVSDLHPEIPPTFPKC